MSAMLFNSFRLTRYLEAKEEEEAALLELPVPPLPSQSPTGKKNPKKKSSGKTEKSREKRPQNRQDITQTRFTPLSK